MRGNSILCHCGAALLLMAEALPVHATSYRLTCAQAGKRGAQPLPAAHFGSGVDIEGLPKVKDGVCASDKAFFVSV